MFPREIVVFSPGIIWSAVFLGNFIDDSLTFPDRVSVISQSGGAYPGRDDIYRLRNIFVIGFICTIRSTCHLAGPLHSYRDSRHALLGFGVELENQPYCNNGQQYQQ
ncbi:MAG TPA: hypothetical protein PLA74_03690 [Syntrophales bacterium]|nr:hypothetical protein [Syntrophales bacterium]HPQ43835.1 hypothetical protein [Syntrophales bacterium]